MHYISKAPSASVIS